MKVGFTADCFDQELCAVNGIALLSLFYQLVVYKREDPGKSELSGPPEVDRRRDLARLNTDVILREKALHLRKPLNALFTRSKAKSEASSE